MGDDKPVIINTSKKHTKAKQQTNVKEPQDQINKSDTTENDNKKTEQPVLKRGHKGKLKKIKEKYKDQDEEDRRLSMLVLQVLYLIFPFMLFYVFVNKSIYSTSLFFQ